MPPPTEPAPPVPRSRVGGAVRRTFSSLDTHNYRLFFGSELVSHTGGWMQTMGEAWLVLTLTGSGAAVGATFAFRFLPVLLFGLWGGVVADRYDRRTILLVTQSLSAVLALGLWLVVLTGVVQVWMVFALAIGLGLVTVVEQPAQHAFIEEMVGRDRLANAVALNSAVGNSARITGPAIAALLIATVGEAWVFLVNALSFVAVVVALAAMRRSELRVLHRPTERPRVREGLAYTWGIEEIRSTIVLVGVVGTLVYNFPTFLTLLAQETFDGGAGLAGVLMAVLGAGTLLGALVAAHRARQSTRTVLAAAAALGLSLLVLAALPTEPLVVVCLVPVGALAVFFGSTANAHMQLWSSPRYRGRVMAVYSLLTLGSTVVGGPLMGWVCQHWTPRAGLGLAGAATLASTAALWFTSAPHPGHDPGSERERVGASEPAAGAQALAQLLPAGEALTAEAAEPQHHREPHRGHHQEDGADEDRALRHEEDAQQGAEADEDVPEPDHGPILAAAREGCVSDPSAPITGVHARTSRREGIVTNRS